MPFARNNTSVNEATLGTLLLCLGVGALIAMPVTGLLTNKFGCRRVILCAIGFIVLTTPLLSVITDPLLLAGVLLLLGVVCFAVFLTEGTVLDWSAVYLTDVRNIPETLGGLGYTCFAVAMTAARLTGDRLIAWLGRLPVVFGGALIAAAGLALVTWVPSWQLSLTGYVLVGAGCANIVPVMFSAVGRQTVMPQAAAVPAMTTMGYLGVLSGPAIIGYVAHYSSLSFAFSLIMALMIMVGAVSFTLNLSSKTITAENP